MSDLVARSVAALSAVIVSVLAAWLLVQAHESGPLHQTAQYVTYREFRAAQDRVEARLGRIEQKIDTLIRR